MERSELSKISNLRRLRAPGSGIQSAAGGPGVLNPHKFTGPMSGPMWQRVCTELRDSAFPDEFDYSVYDKLARRFGDMRPRGGIVFRNFLKMLEAQDCRHCFHRFEMDTYGRGCFHNCAYCYSRSFLFIRKFWNDPQPFPIDIVDARKLFYTIFETDRRHKWREVMEARTPIRLGSMSDSFMWLDKQYGVTREFMKLLKFYNYPATIVTRSDLVAEDEYLEVMDPGLFGVQMSLISLNEKMTRLIEPGAPSPQRRLAAVTKLRDAGFHVGVRINPLFPIYPDGYYSRGNSGIGDSNPLEIFSWDMTERIAEAGAKTVIVGMVRLYQHNLNFLRSALGFSIANYFADSGKLERASVHMSDGEIDYYYRRIHEDCLANNIGFSVCYIGNDPNDRAFDDYRPLWANPRDCCDAVGSVAEINSSCERFPVSESAIQKNLCDKKKSYYGKHNPRQKKR